MSSIKFSLLLTEERKDIMQVVIVIIIIFFFLEVLVEKDNVIVCSYVDQILYLLS